MIRYVLKRIIQLIPVIICVAILIFTILYFTPGDPALLILGENATQEQLIAKRAELGLDQPFFVQLWNFLRDFFLRGDLGTSYVLKTEIGPELLRRLPRTAVIAVVACLCQVFIGIPLGVTAATHQNGLIDRLCVLLAMVGISLPGFWVGLMLILYITFLPSYGIEHWYCYILPCIAASLSSIGSVTRMTRSQMLEVIRSDYVVTARAKGVPERTILYSHALPNALIPIVTYIGTHFGRALGGTVVIETVFSIPGVGYYMTQAVGNRDYPIIRSGVTLLAVIFCVVVLLVDILYAYIDPRVKAKYEGSTTRKKTITSAKGVPANG